MRAVRPLVLCTLILGIALTLVLAPSSLLAQQGPPGQAPQTGGYGGSRVLGDRELAISDVDDESATLLPWLIGAVGAAAMVGGGLFYGRTRAR